MMRGYSEFLKLRREVLNALAKIDMSLGHKSYEGTFELTVSYPGFFDEGSDRDEPDAYIIELHCYVIGPERHYRWQGTTLMGAVRQCREDVKKWIVEELGEA